MNSKGDRASQRALAWQEQTRFRYMDKRCVCCGNYQAALSLEVDAMVTDDTIGSPLICSYCYDNNHINKGLIELTEDALLDICKPPEYYFNAYYGE